MLIIVVRALSKYSTLMEITNLLWMDVQCGVSSGMNYTKYYVIALRQSNARNLYSLSKNYQQFCPFYSQYNLELLQIHPNRAFV